MYDDQNIYLIKMPYLYFDDLRFYLKLTIIYTCKMTINIR